MELEMNEASKIGGDILSLSVVVTTLVDWLPSVAALISIIWGCFRIYETKTVQGWLGRE